MKYHIILYQKGETCRFGQSNKYLLNQRLSHTVICVQLSSISELSLYWSCSASFLIGMGWGLFLPLGMQLFVIQYVMVVLHSKSIFEYYFSSDIMLFFVAIPFTGGVAHKRFEACEYQ